MTSGEHDHPELDAYAQTLAARITSLEGRVAALETQPPVVPPVVPPSPFPGFAAAEAAVSPGGTVDVPAGTYKERFTLAKTGVTWRLAQGAVIDLSGFAIGVQQSGVVIKGDDIKFIGAGEIKGSSASAVTVDGARVTLTANLHHNVEEGYIWHGSDGLILGGSNHHNNETGQMWDSSEQGSGKSNSMRLTIDGCHVYSIGLGGASADAGQGLWFDSIGGTKGGHVVRNCVIHDVFYAGVMFEICDGGKFTNNVVYRCGTTPSGNGFWGGGILIATARNAEVSGNLIVDNKYSGVRILGQNRGDNPGTIVGNVVHDNTFIGNGTAFGYDTDNAAIQATMFAANSGNAAYANRFDVPRAYWKPQGTLTTLAAINALPGGGGSTQLTAAEAATIRADARLTHAAAT